VTSVSSTVAKVAAQLGEAGVESPQAQARTLVCFALDVEPSRLALVHEITERQQEVLTQAVAERISGTPIQHVTGRAYFRTTSVHVGPGVFIPRPETESLAGWGIDQVKTGHARVVELCAGTGAITLAIETESVPEACWAVEASPQAYAYLEENLAGTPGMAVLGDMEHSLTDLNGTIDLVVANPPYIPYGQELPADVLHDPAEALFSGEDGLDAIRVVARIAMRLLKPGGVVGCEHGDDQAERVRGIFAEEGFDRIRTVDDLTNRPRFVTAHKPRQNMQ